MDTKGIDSMLSQLRAASALASSGKTGEVGGVAGAAGAAGSAAPGGVDFSQVLKSTIDQVNQAQQEAQNISQDFASGNSNANLHEVMIALQKANVSFQEMVQVRNKLVTAYQDVMNIQV